MLITICPYDPAFDILMKAVNVPIRILTKLVLVVCAVNSSTHGAENSKPTKRIMKILCTYYQLKNSSGAEEVRVLRINRDLVCSCLCTHMERPECDIRYVPDSSAFVS